MWVAQPDEIVVAEDEQRGRADPAEFRRGPAHAARGLSGPGPERVEVAGVGRHPFVALTHLLEVPGRGHPGRGGPLGRVRDLGVGPVGVIAGRGGDEAADPARIVERQLQPYPGAQAEAEHVGLVHAQLSEQPGHVPGQDGHGHVPVDIGRASVSLQFGSDDRTAVGKPPRTAGSWKTHRHAADLLA
jgi:hypothetical protein